MESKTIRVKRTTYVQEDGRFDSDDSKLTVYLSTDRDPGCQELDVTITPIASPKERLREARIAGLKEFWRTTAMSNSYDEKRIIEVIERIDAEFAKSTPRE